MTRRRAFLHIGPTHTGSDFLEDALAANAAGLAAYGVRCPARPGEEMFRAAVEIRRVHKAWGYRRREVEGTWSAICRRARKGRDTIVISQPHLAAATPDEIALLLDRLDGFDVHIVVTAPRSGADHDLARVVQRWTVPLRGPDRMHVIGPTDADAEAFLWAELGRVVGFDATGLPLPDAARGVACGSTEERLVHVLDELERQRVRNAVLEARNEELAKRRGKLKRRVSDAVAG
ncbi:MAG: hypothetical protein JWO76_3496 [Nocardioides sp.]|nr:hypothetical protein [Nocardioides sp.]